MNDVNQGQFFLPTNAKRGMRFHSPGEIGLCKTLSHAAYLALQHAQITQETAAQAIGVTDGYFSMLMCGKRHWSFHHIGKLIEATHSLAPVQWLNAQYGIGLETDDEERHHGAEDRRRRRAA